MKKKIFSFGFFLILVVLSYSTRAERSDNPPPCHNLSISGTNVTCNGMSDATASITISGGSGNFAITWSNGETNTLTIDSLSAGYYDVEVLDNDYGCTRIAIINITEPDPLSLSVQTTNVNCHGQSTGEIDLTATGGNGNYSYSWSDGASTEDITDISAGYYTCSVTDSEGCSAQISDSVRQPDQALDASISNTEVSCHDVNDASVNLVVWGGTPNYTYVWNTGDNSQNLQPVGDGNYSVTITDEKSCTVSKTVNIANPAELTYNNPYSTNNDCYGDTDGTVGLDVVGGTLPYNFSWADSQYVLSYDTAHLTDLAEDDYYLTVTDAHGCSFSHTFNVSSPEELEIEIENVTDASAFGSTDGAINISFSGGTPPYVKTWSNGATTEDISNIPAGFYTFEVVDAKGCTKSIEVEVSQPTSALKYTYSTEDVTCFNGSDGYIEIYPNGGVEPYTYTWSNGGGNDYITDLQSGKYYCTLSDNNGVVYVDSMIINEPDQIEISFTKTDASCFGGKDADIDLSVSGGTQPYYYQWYDPDYALAGITQDIDSLRAGEYIVQVRDTNGCHSQSTIEIEQPTAINIDITTDDIECYGEATGAVTSVVSGGTPDYNYLWSDGTNNFDAQNLTAGDYGLTVTDDNACEAFAQATVYQPEEILLSTISTPVSCNAQYDGAAEVTASGGSGSYQFMWSTGSPSDRIEDLEQGSYTVTVSDIFNCTKSDTVYVDKLDIDCINIPSSFTPNSDGFNDKWVIRNIYLFPECTIKVFNKWGKIVFESDGYPESWDGKYNGEILPSGTYYYIVKLSPDHEERTGSLTILK